MKVETLRSGEEVGRLKWTTAMGRSETKLSAGVDSSEVSRARAHPASAPLPPLVPGLSLGVQLFRAFLARLVLGIC